MVGVASSMLFQVHFTSALRLSVTLHARSETAGGATMSTMTSTFWLVPLLPLVESSQTAWRVRVPSMIGTFVKTALPPLGVTVLTL